MLVNNTAFNYEMTYKYKGPFETMQCWTIGTVALQCGEKKIRYNMIGIKPHTSDTNVEDIKNWNICMMIVNA